MRSKYKRILAAAGTLIIFPGMLLAADSTPATKSDNGSAMMTVLVSLMVILLFIIGLLGTVIQRLSTAVREKIRTDRKNTTNTVATMVLLLLLMGSGFSTFAADAAKPVAAAVSGTVDGIPANDFYLLIGFIIMEIIVIFGMVISINKLMQVFNNKVEVSPVTGKVIQRNWFWDTFNKAVPIEKEKDLLLDHNYDGIRELDNSLPPWWKYGFILTIIVAGIYLYRYQIAHIAPNPDEEYQAEMQQGEEAKAAYLAKSANNVDETNVTYLKDESSLAAGKDLFIANCAACHRPDAGGVVGPNLTDDYWLHGGSIKDIFKTIKYGWMDKGMKSWKDDFSPVQMQQLSSYIKSIRGTNPPAPKAPQGDLYIEGNTAPAGAATDSIKAGKVGVK